MSQPQQRNQHELETYLSSLLEPIRQYNASHPSAPTSAPTSHPKVVQIGGHQYLRLGESSSPELTEVQQPQHFGIHKSSEPNRTQAQQPLHPGAGMHGPPLPTPLQPRQQHETVTRFLCSECGQFYTNSRKLKQHFTEEHTGEHPYACEICEKHDDPHAFTRLSSLYRHLRSQHDLHIGGGTGYRSDLSGKRKVGFSPRPRPMIPMGNLNRALRQQPVANLVPIRPVAISVSQTLPVVAGGTLEGSQLTNFSAQRQAGVARDAVQASYGRSERTQAHTSQHQPSQNHLRPDDIPTEKQTLVEFEPHQMQHGNFDEREMRTLHSRSFQGDALYTAPQQQIANRSPASRLVLPEIDDTHQPVQAEISTSNSAISLSRLGLPKNDDEASQAFPGMLPLEDGEIEDVLPMQQAVDARAQHSSPDLPVSTIAPHTDDFDFTPFVDVNEAEADENWQDQVMADVDGSDWTF